LSATPNGKHHRETPHASRAVGQTMPRRKPGSTMGWQPSLPAAYCRR